MVSPASLPAIRRQLARALLLCGAVLGLLAGGDARAWRFERDSAAWRELMETRLGDDAAAAGQWSPLLRREGWPDQAEQLRRTAVWRLLQAANGERPDPQMTIGQAIELGTRLSYESLNPLLDSALQRQWQVRFVDRPEPPPAEWARGGDTLNEVAPGLWWRGRIGSTPGPTALVLELAHRGTVPLAVQALRVSAPDSAAAFTCERANRQPLGLLMPGQSLRLHCNGNVHAGPGDARLEALAATFSAGNRTPPRLTPERDRRADAVAWMAFAVENATLAGHAEAAAFAQRNAHCERRGTCGTASRARASQAAPPATPKKPKIHPIAANWLILVTGFWAYCGLALWLGQEGARRTGFVFGLVLLVPIVFMAVVGVGSYFGGQGGWKVAGIVIAIPAALLWAWIVSRVLAWLYAVLFGERGVIAWIYRGVRSEPAARRLR